MKTVILILATTLYVANCNAAMHSRDQMVSEKAVSAFSKQYQHVHVKKWEIKNDTCIAKFTMSKRKRWAFYLSNGNWLKTETKLPWTWDLPETVQNSWNNCKYNSWQIEVIKQIESPNENIYTMQVYKDFGPPESIPGDNEEKYILYFHSDGSLYMVKQIEFFLG